MHWCVGSIEGEPDKSFKICVAGEKAGLWGDFAESGKHSRSLLDLWMHARKCDFKTALRESAQWLGQPLIGRGIDGSIFPTLDKAISNMERRLSMRITRRDSYHDRSGNEHFVVVRFDDADRKDFRPFCPNGSAWIAADPPGKLPLFRLPELITRPGERVFIFRSLLEQNGTLKTGQVEKLLRCSKPTALKEMEALAVLGIADKTEGDAEYGRPEHELQLAEKFQWFATDQCKGLRWR